MLSVVIIGRNGAGLLPGCIESVRAALSEGAYEILYVDAHSGDDSVQIALDLGVRVLTPDSRETTPALGRHIGTLAARGEYILFLDHDMRLMPDFVEAALPEMERGGWSGASGQRKDIYLVQGRQTGEKDNYFGCITLREAPVFGGAILLSRQALLTAGNWTAGVATCEEVELYARLKKGGYRVVELPVPMIEHLDEQRDGRSFWKVLFNRRRLGLGQAARAALGAGSLWQLFRLEAPAFLVFLLDVLSLIALVWAGLPALPLLLGIQLLIFVGCCLTQGPRSYVTHTLGLCYLPAGLLSYRPRDTGYTCREEKEKT